MKNLLLSMSVVLLITTATHGAAIVNPTLVSSSANELTGGEPSNLTDQSGLSAAVNTGDSLANALAVTHSFNGGFTDSWVTNASAPDYFTAGPTPVFVYDLGEDVRIDDFIAWQYQNTGGGGTSAGNAARSMDLRFNTEAEGSGTFSGAATSLTLKPVHDGDGSGPNDLGGVNSAQDFGLSETYARYVEVRVTDNYRGLQGVTSGGDRVGLGELRFNATELYIAGASSVTTSVAASAGTNEGNLIDESGLDAPVEWNKIADINHSGYVAGAEHYVTGDAGSDYFVAGGTAPVLTFTLDDTVLLTAIAVWNYTGASFNASGNGASEILVEVSTNGIDFETVTTIFPSIVPNAIGSNPGEFLSLGGDFLASHVRLTLLDNYADVANGGDRVGLAEVQFIAAVPTPAGLSAGLALLAMTAMRRKRRL